MRILLLCGKMDEGGVETHVRELCLGLKNRGHGIILVSAGGKAAVALERAGIRHIYLPLDSKSPIDILLCRRIIKNIVKKYRIDILHAHTRISALAAEGIGEVTPLVVTAHAKFKMGGVYSRLSRWGSRTIAVSRDIKEHLIAKSPYVSAKNIDVIGNGVDTEEFSPRKGAHGKVIAFLSRLDGDCSAAAYSLCRIARKLNGRYPDARILIGGGGSELGDLRRLAAVVNRKVGRRMISVVGDVDDVPEFLRRADIFVGVSRAAIEAMACGLSVILAGNEGFGGIADSENIKIHQRTNFCCRGEGVISDGRLLGAVCALLGESEDAREAREESLRRYVESELSAEHMAELTERVYMSAVKSVPRRGVLLCGYYGYGNMGDDMLLRRSALRARRTYPALGVCALSAHGSVDSAKFGIRCVNRWCLPHVMKEIGEAELVVFGGGTLLQNSTSRRSLWYYLFIIFYAAYRGRAVELWGNGIGEIEGRLTRLLVARALSVCRRIGLRDAYSLRAARALGARHAFYERDLALSRSKGGREMSGDGEKYALIAPKGGEKPWCIRRLAGYVKCLSDKGFVPLYLPMYPKQDLGLCRALAAHFGGITVQTTDEDTAAELVKHAQLLCGMRYHALVLAVNAGTPYIAIGSQQKIKSFGGGAVEKK